MKFFILFFFMMVNAFADDIQLIRSNEAGKKYSFHKAFELVADAKGSFTLEAYCNAIATTPRLLTNDLQKHCANQSMFFDSASYSSCKWSSDQSIDVTGEFQCLTRPSVFDNLKCQTENDCRKQWYHSVLAKLPDLDTSEGSKFMDSEENLMDFRDCHLILSKILFAPLNEVKMPKICEKVIENFEAFKQ